MRMNAKARPAAVRSRWLGMLTLGLALAAAGAQPSRAQVPVARSLITAPVDESRLVTLAGNTRAEANASNDRGRVPDSFPMQHMQLLLKRPAERELALQRYIAELHDRSSPNFHRWLSAAAFAQRFGLSQQDLVAVADWL